MWKRSRTASIVTSRICSPSWWPIEPDDRSTSPSGPGPTVGVREAQAAHGGRVLRPLLRRAAARSASALVRASRRERRAAARVDRRRARRARRRSRSERRPHDARLPRAGRRGAATRPPAKGRPRPPLPSAWICTATWTSRLPRCRPRGRHPPLVAVPDVLAPEPALRLLRHQPGPRLGRRARALREPAQRLLAAAPRRRLHAAALRPVGAVRAARRSATA